jgi:hypothetical protein
LVECQEILHSNRCRLRLEERHLLFGSSSLQLQSDELVLPHQNWFLSRHHHRSCRQLACHLYRYLRC